MENLEFSSKLGRPSEYTYRHHHDEKPKLAIILPGQAYFKDAPVMWYSALAAYEAGADTLSVEYAFQANRLPLGGDAMGTSLDELKSSLVTFLKGHKYEKIAMISKSIGTNFARLIGDIGDSTVSGHLFLTPLKSTLEFMGSARNMEVIVGEKDPLFGMDEIAAVRSMKSVRITSFPGANHLLEIPGNVMGSLHVLQQVTELCHSFMKRI